MWFYVVAALAAGIGLWFDAQPYVCPVPNGLLSQTGSVPCFEFWFARYQTIVAAIIAVVGVIYATRPALRQIELMERRAAFDARQFLKGRYQMLDELQKLFSADDWLESQEKIPHPQTAEFATFMNGRGDPRAYMTGIFEEKCKKLRGLLERASTIALEGPERDAVFARIPAFEKGIVDARKSVADSDKRVSQQDLPPSSVNTYTWFHYIDAFDPLVAHHMRLVAKDLDALKTDVVSKLAG